MSPPLNKYKNNPEKQTRAAINILPYIRNNALYLLFGSIYITLNKLKKENIGKIFQDKNLTQQPSVVSHCVWCEFFYCSYVVSTLYKRC